MAHERAASGRKAQVPVRGNGPSQPAASQVRARLGRLGRFRTHQLQMIELRRLLADLLQAGFAAARKRRACVGNLDARPFRQPANRLGKAQVFKLHDVRKDIAAFAASEAVPQLGGWVYLARRRALLMEGTAAPEIAPALAQGRPLSHERDQIARLAHAAHVLFADARHAAPFLPVPAIVRQPIVSLQL